MVAKNELEKTNDLKKINDLKKSKNQNPTTKTKRSAKQYKQ
jgi:hypothetical protein